LVILGFVAEIHIDIKKAVQLATCHTAFYLFKTELETTYFEILDKRL